MGISDCEPLLAAISEAMWKVSIKAELCGLEVDK
jgi:hypothetical protein